jgi:hypothetical protein
VQPREILDKRLRAEHQILILSFKTCQPAIQHHNE